MAEFTIGAAPGGASRTFDFLKNRVVSYGNPVSEEIDFGGSVGSIAIRLVTQGPTEGMTFTVRMSGVGGSYQQSYSSEGRAWVNESKAIPQLPKGRYVVEVFSSSQNEWKLLSVGLRYMNGMSRTLAAEAPAQAPCTCAALLAIMTIIMGLLTWVL